MPGSECLATSELKEGRRAHLERLLDLDLRGAVQAATDENARKTERMYEIR